MDKQISNSPEKKNSNTKLVNGSGNPNADLLFECFYEKFLKQWT